MRRVYTRYPASHKRYDNGRSVDIMALITETRDIELTKDLNMRQETGLKFLVTPRTKNRLANSKAPTYETNDFSNENGTFSGDISS